MLRAEYWVWGSTGAFGMSPSALVGAATGAGAASQPPWQQALLAQAGAPQHDEQAGAEQQELPQAGAEQHELPQQLWWNMLNRPQPQPQLLWQQLEWPQPDEQHDEQAGAL